MRDYQLSFLFLDLFRLFQIVVEVGSTAELEDGTEAVVVDLNCVEVLDHSAVVKLLVDFILSQSMLDVVVFDLVVPAVIKMMDFACDFAAVLQVEGFVDL